MTSVDTSNEYQVVARKYRPQSFQGLIGQSHISTALSNAINQNRIGHAYLFTGARGVGKTSSARIFAKCLNCVNGPTIEPCNECDLCQAISIGEDVDVLEIDGASNRGIDEIRQLRSNVSIRPSRGRFKIYIIDEVHMLTTPAFNALLKTLEEPPAHVKFIFCTTDPHKIPITVLSRCQRFDFSPVQTTEIAQSLTNIAATEGVETDPDAIVLLARRANGSMRDSQSLLEQLFSFCDGRITVALVNQLLGTADTGRIAQLATALIEGNPAQALGMINQATLEGVDAGQFARQLLGYFRDLMAIKIGCDQDTLLSCSPGEVAELQVLGQQVGLETILSIMQLIDAAVVKMQHSLHARTLLEMAAVRICSLEKLDSLADLVDQLTTAKDLPKKKIVEVSTSAVTQQITPSINNDIGSVLQSATEPPILAGSQPDHGIESDVIKGDPVSLSPHASFSPGTANARLQKPTVAADSRTERLIVSGDTSTSEAIAVAAPGVDLASEKQTSSPSAEVAQAAINQAALGDNTNSKESTNKPSIEPLTELTACWNQMVEEFGGLTAEMLADYESLAWAAENRVITTLKDDYKIQECSKPEKKKRAETLLSTAIGRNVKIEFRGPAKRASRGKEIAPRLSRAQELRMLQGDEFVQEAMAILDAEIVNFYRPQTNTR